MFKFMSHFKFLVVPLALMLVAMVAIFGFGCGMFPDSGGDTSAKLQTVNKAIAQAVVLAYQSGGNQLPVMLPTLKEPLIKGARVMIRSGIRDMKASK